MSTYTGNGILLTGSTVVVASTSVPSKYKSKNQWLIVQVNLNETCVNLYVLSSVFVKTVYKCIRVMLVVGIMNAITMAAGKHAPETGSFPRKALEARQFHQVRRLRYKHMVVGQNQELAGYAT